MKTYELKLSDGNKTSICIDDEVTTINKELDKLDKKINKFSVDGDKKSANIIVDIISYNLIND